MPNNVSETTPGQSDRAARLSKAAWLYLNSPPEPQKNWWQINPNLIDYHSDPVEISSTFWLLDITDWWCQQEETHSKYTDLSNVGRDIFSIIPYGVGVEASFSLRRGVIGQRQCKTPGETFREKVVVSCVSDGSGCTRNRTMATPLGTRKTWIIGNGPILPPIPRHSVVTILPPIDYLSSDHIMTWSVRTLCGCRRSSTSCCQICDGTNIRWIAIEHPQILPPISCYFTPIQGILVHLQICTWEVEEWLPLDNQCTDHFVIHWDLRYLIVAKVAGTIKWNSSPGTSWPKNSGFMSGPGYNHAKTKRVGFLSGYGTEPNCLACSNLDRWRVTLTIC